VLGLSYVYVLLLSSGFSDIFDVVIFILNPGWYAIVVFDDIDFEQANGTHKDLFSISNNSYIM